MKNNTYFKCENNKKSKRIRLFCFPYAGGNSSIFHSWDKKINTEIEVISVQLPGRANRILEKPINNMNDLIEILYYNIKPYISEPFAFFGHSMGGMIAYALTQKIESITEYKPEKLIISATNPPHYYTKKEHKYTLTDNELIEVLRDYNGTPEILLSSQELMEICLPAIRSDFQIIETYIPNQIESLESSVVIFNAEDDINKECILEWQEYFIHKCDYRNFNGEHFFIHMDEEEIIKNINNILTSRNLQILFNKDIKTDT